MSIDEIFSPGGLAFALESGCGFTARVAGHFVALDGDDLQCSACGHPLRPPRDCPGRYLALNKLLNDGATHCPDCMPPE